MTILYYIDMCVHVWLYVHDYVMVYFFILVILRSTTGPYGRPIVEDRIWGDIMFTPPRLYGSCKLGKSGWGVDMMSPMLDIPRSTPV